MKWLVFYNPETGEITARCNINVREGQAWENALEISGEEYDRKPEIHKKVDLATLTLVDK